MKSIQQYIFLGIALLLLGSSYWLDITDRKGANLEKYAGQIQNYLEINEASVLEVFEDEDKIKRFIAKDYDDKTWKEIQSLTQEKYSFFIYEKDSLLFWSTNTVIPAIEEIRATSERQFKIIKLNDSRFELVKEPIIIDNHKYILCGLIPIYYEYDIKNEHIDNHFALESNIPKKVFISDVQKDQVVFNPRGEEIFYLTALQKFTDYTMRVILLLMYGFGFLFLGAFMNRVSIRLSRKRSPIIGFIFLVLSVFLVRYFSLSVSENTVFSDIPLFEAQELVSPVVSGSMSLFINIVLLLWVVIFFYREVPIKDPSKYQIFRQYFLVFASYGMVSLAILWINRIVQSLVSLSRVTFDYDNVFELNEYSFIGLVSISILVILLFFFSHKIIPSVNKANIPREHKIAFGGIILGLSLLGAILGITNWGLFYLVAFSFGYIALFEAFTKDNIASFQWLGGFIFIYSFFITGLLVYHNVEREQEQRIVFADRLVTKRDLATEEAFISIENKLFDANIIRNLRNPLVPKLSIIAAITNINKKQKYLNREYEFDVFFYDVNGKKIRGETRPFGEFEEIVSEADSTLSPNLYFSKSEVGYSYIAKLTILNNDRRLGYIIIHYEPKSAIDLDVYPELLKDRSLAKNTGVNYDYAVYKNGKLVKDKGGPFEDSLSYKAPEKSGRQFIKNRNGYSNLIYRADESQVVVVKKELNEITQYLSLFSYVFIFLLLVLLILVILRRTTNIFPKSITDTFSPKPSLHSNIQTSILAIIILTFLTIGMVTFFYFRSNITALQFFKVDALLSVFDRILVILVCSVLLWGNVIDTFKIEYFIYAQTFAYSLTALFGFGSVILLAKKTFSNFVKSNDAYFNGESQNPVQLIAQSVFEFNEPLNFLHNSYKGTNNALMTYKLAYGSSIHRVGSVTKNILNDIGWLYTFSGSNSPGPLEVYNYETGTLAPIPTVWSEGDDAVIINRINSSNSSDPFIIAEITSPGIKFLLRPMVEDNII